MRLIRYSSAFDPDIAALFHDAVHSSCRCDCAPDELAAWAPDDIDPASFCKRLSGSFAVLAAEGSVLAGFGSADTSSGCIDMLFTAAHLQGRGIGSLILRTLERECKAPCWAYSSYTALPFFRRMGYVPEREDMAVRRGVALGRWLVRKV